MTNLTNGHQPTHTIPPTTVVGNMGLPDQEPRVSSLRTALDKRLDHPNQPQLNMLIHAQVVTHVIRVDEVPDPLFALSQIHEMPEVRFAAVFHDGLIALGCPDGLPDALAELAVLAKPSAPARSEATTGLDRIEEVSERLAGLVDAMVPEEVILNDQLGRDILHRLRSLETRDPSAGPTLEKLEGHLATVQDRLSELPSVTDTLAPLMQRITQLEESVTQLKPHDPDILTEKLEQLGVAQRASLGRVEAAMGKTLAGLAPALDHLNARAAETEHRLSNWHSDLKTLSQKTRSIAEYSSELPKILTALQNDLSVVASRPDPQLDLTAQNASFAEFSNNLCNTLTEMQAVARKSEEQASRTAVQSDETIATLQTLPNLISATMRRDIDLAPITGGIGDLMDQLQALPGKMNISAIVDRVEALSEQIHPIATQQTSEFGRLQDGVQTFLTKVETIKSEVAQLQSKEPDFGPLAAQLNTVQQNQTQHDQDIDARLDVIRDTLGQLLQHLGVLPRHGSHMVAGAPLVPDTSLNTLRMEFADLITKRMEENDATIPDRSRSA